MVPIDALRPYGILLLASVDDGAIADGLAPASITFDVYVTDQPALALVTARFEADGAAYLLQQFFDRRPANVLLELPAGRHDHRRRGHRRAAPAPTVPVTTTPATVDHRADARRLVTVATSRRAFDPRARFDKLSSVTQLDHPSSDAADRAPTASFVLNGTPVSVYRRHPHLLAALREELDVTSPKDGCSPSGQCGCCTVLIDGKAVVSCQQPLDKIDGLVDRHPRGRRPAASVRRSATPSRHAAGCSAGSASPASSCAPRPRSTRRASSLTRDAMKPHLGAHLCRCTGYVKVLDAIEAVAQGRTCTPELSGEVGGRGAKYEAAELTLGDRGYVDDIRVPGMLHAALRLTDHARADITSIDPAAALAADGVVAVFTAADIPGDLRVGLIHKDWPVMIPVGGRTSCAGDVLAIVVAETREQARDAVDLVAVGYDVHRPNTDPVAALADGAPLSVWGTDSNTLSVSTYARGDVDGLLAASAFTVHETFRTQRIEHAFLEPESSLAVPSGAGDERRPARVLRWSGRVGRPQRHRRRAAARPLARHRRAGVERWRVRWQGGHVEPGARGARGMAARPAGEVHAVARGELPHPRQAPPDHARVPGRLRRRGHPHRAARARHRRLGRLRERRHEGARTRRRARLRAVPLAGDRRRDRSPCARTTSCAARSAGSAPTRPSSRWKGVLDRLAEQVGISGWEIRKRNVIRSGDVWGPGQIMDDGAGGAEACLDAHPRRVRGRAAPPARPSGSGSA